MMEKDPVDIQLPVCAVRLPVFVGVLKRESPLCDVFGGRVVPLRHGAAVQLNLAKDDGTAPAATCYLVPLEMLTPEHTAALVEWVARRYGVDLEEAKRRLEAEADFPVDVSHFAAAFAGKRKKGAAPA